MTRKFGPLGPIFYTPTKVAPIGLQMKFQVKPAENFQEKRQKPIYILTYFDQKRPDNLVHRGHFSHTPESTHNIPVNKISWSCIKNFFEKMAKDLQNSQFFYLFIVMKDQ